LTSSEAQENADAGARLDKVADGGIFVAHAPAAAIAVGLLGGQTIRAGDATFTFPDFTGNFAAMTLTAMDNQPIVQSRRILLTLVNRAENQGMGWNAARTSVSNQWGRGPTLVTAPPATVTLKTDGPRQVFALDAHRPAHRRSARAVHRRPRWRRSVPIPDRCEIRHGVV
jgi:hypothetical protein